MCFVSRICIDLELIWIIKYYFTGKQLNKMNQHFESVNQTELGFMNIPVAMLISALHSSDTVWPSVWRECADTSVFVAWRGLSH